MSELEMETLMIFFFILIFPRIKIKLFSQLLDLKQCVLIHNTILSYCLNQEYQGIDQ